MVPVSGLLVIDKPGGMTSRAVVDRIKYWFPRKTKLGHTGTLDPLATGVLVVCVGAATRLAGLVQNMGKSYHSRFQLGCRSTTDDIDGEVTEVAGTVLPTRDRIESALAPFVGTITQVPPCVSAAKVGGRRAYTLVRDGHAVALAPRTVRVDAVRVLGYVEPFLDVEIDCGKGTYIRSIARDLGESLGCGAMVTTLRRTRVGNFRAEDAVALEDEPETALKRLLPLTRAASELPSVCLDPGAVARFRHGLATTWPDPKGGVAAGPVAVMDSTGELIGLGSPVGADLLRPDVVLAMGVKG